jgi:hypothetical protein
MSYNHWLIRVDTGDSFKNSSKYNIWGCKSNTSKSFLKDVQPGDKLWFITNKSKGKIIAVASFESHNERILGPLIGLSMSNDELGWSSNSNIDTEIHYKDLYNLDQCELNINIKSTILITKYVNEKYDIDLDNEYKYIVKYCFVVFSF